MKINLLWKSILVLFFVLLIKQTVTGQDQKITFSETWGKQGMSLVSQSTQEVRLNVSLENFVLNSLTIDNRQMNAIILPGVFLPGEEGEPDLPVYSRYVAVPNGAEVVATITKERVESMQNMEIAPSMRIPKDDERGPSQYKAKASVYEKNSLYPEQFIRVSEKMKIRGVDVVLVSVSPFQYNPVSKELLVHRDIEIEISFKGGTGEFGEERLRSRYWEPIIRDMVINQATIPAMQPKKHSRSDGECEYLIIVPNDNIFLAWADSIRIFRQKQGIETNVVTTTEVGGNTISAIENYVNNAYNNWSVPPAAVLLMGDYGNSGSTIISPIYDNYCASDNMFADVDNDYLPDVVFARMTAQNEAHLETMVTKFLNYERNPPTNPDFYEHPITAMGWQTERWFQLCSEVVAGFFETGLGKSPVRENAIYEGNPDGGVWSTATNTSTVVNYFGPNGLGYIPNTPDFLDDWGGNPTRINNDINDGAFVLQHRDHGFEQGWGEPAYSSSDINALYNEDLTFVFSVNCLTGKFNMGGECFTEKFHRHQYGALGLIAASEVSYSFVNDAFVWGMYDNLWPDFMPAFGTNPESRDVRPAFGNAAGKYFLQQSNWPYNSNNKEVTYNLFHHHGDAFSVVYYEVPSYLTIIHDEVLLGGMDYFTVQANPGSFISLTIGNQIIATAEGTGSPLDISIPEQEPGVMIDIVITKQNFYRYENTVEVIPPDGPYCMYKSHTVNDSLGNDNNKAEFEEIVFFNTNIKNMGSDDALNTTILLSTENQFIEIIDGNEMYDTISSGETILRNLAYKILVSDSIPDQELVRFDLLATDENGKSWESKFFVIVAAPKIKVGDMTIDDSEFGNNNGRLDPGETADLKIKTSNKGHAIAKNVLCSLVAYNQYITVVEGEKIIPSLSTFGASYPAFRVTASTDAPQAVLSEMHYTVSAAGYEVSQIYYPKVGTFIEDWETGNFNKYEWVQGGHKPWVINTEFPFQGAFDVASGTINNNQTSSFSITYEVMGNDIITFNKKVSSQTDGDLLKFYVNGALRATWSGTSQGWTQESFQVGPGVNTFKWEYAKNGTGVSGSDKAWVDNIVLPTRMVTTLFAGPDAEICSGSDFHCYGTATNQESISWTTSGSGTFSNIGDLKPVYTPSESDIQNGLVTLTMSIVDLEEETYSDSMILTVNGLPAAPEMPSGPDMVDVFKTESSDYSITSVPNATSYFWQMEPSEAGELIVSDTAATIIWNHDFTGEAALSAGATDECGQSELSESLIISVTNTVDIDELVSGKLLTVSPNPNDGNFNLTFRSKINSEVKITLINPAGMTLSRFESPVIDGCLSYKFNRQELSAGVYFILVEQAGKIYSKKLLISE